MNKLHDALTELQQQRKVIDNAIAHLELAISAFSGSPFQFSKAASSTAPEGRPSLAISREGSHLANAYKVLKDAEEKELHISVLVERINALTGNTISRASIEGALSRNIRLKGNGSSIIRTKASTYAINPDFPSLPL